MTSTFPKLMRIRGVEIVANSWEEADEIVARYGGSSDEAPTAAASSDQPTPTLNQRDRKLLDDFVKSGERGLLVKDIRIRLGRSKGKVGSALKAWSAEIGLMTQ